MDEYWNSPTATAAAFTSDGYFLTGDAGYLDEEGYLYVCDRIKDMIVSGGENIYPAEIENALCGHPLVDEAAVIGVPDEKWGESAKALIVSKDGVELDGEAISKWLRTLIAGYKIPKSFEVVESLPRNASGKILRRVLREPFWSGRERRVN